MYRVFAQVKGNETAGFGLKSDAEHVYEGIFSLRSHPLETD